ncbi:helix-turn-helix domain-containing protein [Ensifer sp. 2YAB10]|uniref:helix-turn-helix domain-containing protein n=1 Tax=Ensifer sp. 2YAB10 TaxID=3233021 RepID=UPI003F8FB58C
MALQEELSGDEGTPRPTVKRISAGDITVTRTFSDRFDLEPGPLIPVADAFNVIIQMRDFEAHRLWRRGELVYEGGHPKASLAITDLRDQWQCHHLKGTLAPWQERLATEFLVAHFNTPFSIGDLAAQCELSRSYFNKAFKESFGRTPSRWLSEYRIARVKECLLQDIPLAEIAIHCGFADQSHMTRVFTSQTGETPARFRKKNRSVIVAVDRPPQ